MINKLYRSSDNKIVAGVCGGLGEYFNIDPTLVRLIAVISIFAAHGWIIIGYLLAIFIIPKKVSTDEQTSPTNNSTPKYSRPEWLTYLPGVLLVGFGLMLIIDRFFWFHWGDFWPIILILAGVGFLIYSGTRSVPVAPKAENGNGVESNGGQH